MLLIGQWKVDGGLELWALTVNVRNERLGLGLLQGHFASLDLVSCHIGIQS